MVKTPSWLGKPESDHLEYKREASLRDPGVIAREVVAMLNTGGGLIVIGVDDLRVPRGVTDAAAASERLLQALLDLIEPRVDTVTVRVVPIGDVEVIEVDVIGAGPRAIHAERRQGRYGFWQRVGSTTQPLRLHEALARHQRRTPVESPDDWFASLEGTEPVMVVRCLPETPRAVQAHALNERVLSPSNRALIRGREMAWDVLVDDKPHSRARRWALGDRRGRQWLEVDLETAAIRFEGRRSFLEWKKPPYIPEPVIHPYPLVEGTVSFLRLAGTVARELGLHGPVDCELGLWAVQGWRLGPYRPGTVDWEMSPARWQPALEENTAPAAKHRSSWGELAQTPDPHARALLEQIYAWFGYDDPKYVPFWSEGARRFDFGG